MHGRLSPTRQTEKQDKYTELVECSLQYPYYVLYNILTILIVAEYFMFIYMLSQLDFQ